MTTDYRALCAELIQAWDGTSDFDYNDFGNAVKPLIARARTALAQPEPEFTTEEIEMIQAPWSYLSPAQQPEPAEPSDEELRLMAIEWGHRSPVEFARAVLQRYGHPTIAPIPVSERLPGPGDYDEDETCWWWSRYVAGWCRCDARYSDEIQPEWTHWLPASALPVPQSE